MAAKRRRNRTRRSRGRFRALYQLLAVAAVVAAVAAGCFVFFRVETVTVSGNNRYSVDEVVAVSGVELGDYLALLDKNRIARQIRSGLPYVESVSIRRSLPDTVIISVSESSAAAVVETESGFWLINSAGKLLEQVSSTGAYAHIIGLSPIAPTAGSMAVLSDEAVIRWDYAMEFLRTLEEQEMLDELTSLDCSAAGTFTAAYGERFTLILPSTGNFSEYLAMFTRAVEEELEDGETGIFDFTHYDTTGYVYFRHA